MIRRVEEPVRGRLLSAVRWFADAEQRLCGAMEQGGGAALQRETLLVAGELERLYSEDPPSAYRQLSGALREASVPRLMMVEYLDGINLALVRQEYRDRVQFRQLARTRLAVPGLVALALTGKVEDSARDEVRRLADAAALVSVLERVGADLERGCVLIPQEDLLRHGVSSGTLMERRAEGGLLSLVNAWLNEARGHLSPGAGMNSNSAQGILANAVRASLAERIVRIEKAPACVFEVAAPPPKSLLQRLFPFLGKSQAR